MILFVTCVCLMTEIVYRRGTFGLCMTSTLCQLSPLLLCAFILLGTYGLTDVCDFIERLGVDKKKRDF